MVHVSGRIVKFSGTVIAAVPQDLKFEGEDSQVIIGDNTVIRSVLQLTEELKLLDIPKLGMTVSLWLHHTLHTIAQLVIM